MCGEGDRDGGGAVEREGKIREGNRDGGADKL